MDTPLRGRDGQLATVESVLDRVTSGRGAVLVVEAPLGVGKTRMLAEIGARARDRGMHVAHASCDELDRYAPLAPLLGALASGRDPVVVQGALRDGAADVDRRFWLLERVAELLAERADRQPVAVLLDDVHWADPATLVAVRKLVPQLATSPVLWVLAIRLNHSGQQLQRVLDRLTESGATTLRLRGLAPQDVQALAEDVLGSPPPQTLKLLDGAYGNPGLIIELLTSLPDAGSEDAARGPDALLPERFRARVLRRVSQLSAATRQLLDVGAVIGPVFTPAHVATLLGQTPPWLLSTVAEAIADGLIIDTGDALRFRHALVRQAVYDSLPTPVRSALHRDIAQLLLAEGESPAAAASHLLASDRGGDPRTIAALADAVDKLAATAPRVAADLATRALATCAPDDARRPHLVTRAVELLTWTHDVAGARRLADTVRHLPLTPDDNATVRMSVAVGLMFQGRIRDALDYICAAFDLPGVTDGVRAQLLAVQAWAHLLAGRYADARDPAAAAIELAERIGDQVAEVTALGVRSALAYHAGDPTAAVAFADKAVTLRLAAPAARVRLPRLWLSIVLAGTDRLDEAVAVSEAGVRAAEDLGALWAIPNLHARQAWAHLEAGRLDEAVAAADAAAEASTGLGLPRELIVADTAAAVVALHRGDLTTATDRLDTIRTRLTPDVQPLHVLTGWAEALLLDARGDVDAAGRVILDTFGRSPIVEDMLVLPVTAAPSLVRVMLRSGHVDIAERFAALAEQLAVANPQLQAIGGTARYARGLINGDVDLLTDAMFMLKSAGRPLAALSAAEERSRVLLRADRQGSAVPALLDTLHVATGLGAVAAADRLRRLLRGAGVRRQPPIRRRDAAFGWDALSESELRVARLAAEGLTNQAIADRLFVSPHTVNTHLRHVFAKLAINRRVELTRVVLAHAEPATGAPSADDPAHVAIA